MEKEKFFLEVLFDEIKNIPDDIYWAIEKCENFDSRCYVFRMWLDGDYYGADRFNYLFEMDKLQYKSEAMIHSEVHYAIEAGLAHIDDEENKE